MIVFAVPDFDPTVGGTTRQTRLQAESLASRGNEVLVVTRRLHRGFAKREHLHGLDVVRVGPPGRGPVAEKRALLSLTCWLSSRRRRVRILQIVMWPDAIFSATAASLARRTAVLWAIQGEITQTVASGSSAPRRAQSWARRRALVRAEHVTLTHDMAMEFDQVRFPASNTIIPVPVDREHFRPPTPRERDDARRALGLAPDAFTVVYVGHLQARKAVDRLIGAVEELRASVPHVHLLIVGGARGAPDDTETALRRQVADAGLGESVTFCGIAPDPRTFLWASDVLALPSEREGMPNSLLEALACGLPCVAPASAGGAAVLDDDVGIVPPSNESSALAAALAKLAADDEARRRMGEAARSRSERYDVERVADDYERLYEQIVKKG
jgi:glycosyltransferase involved in cell wall biosynthesis